MSAEAIAQWLIAEGRLFSAPARFAEALAERLVAAGVPLSRMRLGQRLANPLLSAWGVIWTPATGGEEYTVRRAQLATDEYRGSPFQHVVETRTPFRRRLDRLDAARDHRLLHELAAAGATDYLALPLVYGDGSVQGTAFVSDAAAGFPDQAVTLLESLSVALAAAMEPMAMRRSMASLLATYLGKDPAARVLRGAIHRGDIVETEAAVILTDLRGFTALSVSEPPAGVLAALGAYFETIVGAVHAHDGDALKFIGDGVLSIVPVVARDHARACAKAAAAMRDARARLAETPFVAALHVGAVIYGNIGSPDRLDFTVLGPSVNLVSRLEGIAKETGRPIVCSAPFAEALGTSEPELLGHFPVRGFPAPQAVFALNAR
jgi:adenylate cyclase